MNSSEHALPQESRHGYPKMADFIGLEPQIAIFKRFGALNAENLLFMQAEIAGLEEDLRVIVANDSSTANEDKSKRQFATSWRVLQEAGNESAQWRKRIEIRERLKEYNAALLQCIQLQRLDNVHEKDLGVLHDWLWYKDNGGLGFLYDDRKDSKLDASTKDLYEEPKDLISLAERPGGKDDFTELLRGRILKFFHDKFLYRFRGNSTYDDRKLLQIADTIVTIVSSLLIVVSTIVLYYIHSTIARLWTVAGFNILFAFILKMFTNGERIGIFAAAAAFASVQVVFIGTTSGTTSNQA